jgi:hypothetical protein
MLGNATDVDAATQHGIVDAGDRKKPVKTIDGEGAVVGDVRIPTRR